MGSFWVYLILTVVIVNLTWKISSKTQWFKRAAVYVNNKKSIHRHNLLAKFLWFLLIAAGGFSYLYVTVFLATYFPFTFLDRMFN